MASARLSVSVGGAVQGVGFRPFVFRLASQLALKGWVCNSPQGVRIEVEGLPPSLESFLSRLQREKPAAASIQSLEHSVLDPVGYPDFNIRPSCAGGAKTALVLPDLATCAECLLEIFDPADRRHLYPFANCAHCGPRYSIIEGLPYDRAQTTMRAFAMCPACKAEYEDPQDRRFHAQPNACPDCGPSLALWDPLGQATASRHEALLAAAALIRGGAIVAVKGIGGFHLVADARSEDPVGRLRERKRREEKPFALMFPTLAAVKACARVSALEERMLLSPAAPIVLLERLAAGSVVAEAAAPGNPSLGIMLPSAPLQHLLMRELGFPVIATSANLADEPICTDEREALARLAGIADAFLVHDRPILRHVDDSIVREMAGRQAVLRRARGFAPLPVRLSAPPPALLAVGAQQKNVVALTVAGQAHLSQHIGDLETAQAFGAFEGVVDSLQRLYETRPALVVCDEHPGYVSTRFARGLGLPVLAVQHHYAHALSCLCENELEAPALAVVWDGTGYGPDGTIWGGEFLRITRASYERFAHWRTFPLPGGEKAVREPRRAALGLLYEIFAEGLLERREIGSLAAFSERELTVLRSMCRGRVNSPATSSAGRLFDAVASLVGLRQKAGFEGQAAMALEFSIDASVNASYPLPVRGAALDWEPMIREILTEAAGGVAAGRIAAKFHNTLVEAVVETARRAGEEKVLLTGGCFQNKYLLERAVRRLRDEGFRPYWHQRVPPNDGGIALGQAAAAARERS